MLSCTNSTGSSMVMMWSSRCLLTWSIMRRERGGFARAGRAGDDDQALREEAEVQHRLRQVELLARSESGWG